MFHKVLIVVVLLIPLLRPSLKHPYQHPRLLVYKDGKLLYADVDGLGNITGYRPRDPWKPHPLDDPK